ncbi:hypothetical protein Emag_004081 [Eimeria magna]
MSSSSNNSRCSTKRGSSSSNSSNSSSNKSSSNNSGRRSINMSSSSNNSRRKSSSSSSTEASSNSSINSSSRSFKTSTSSSSTSSNMSSSSSSSSIGLVVPILNENDSTCTEELRFGDNDTLAAHCAVALEADFLFILTDVNCLYTRNPRQYPDARPVWFVGRFTDVYSYLSVNDSEGAWGTGGIHTKVVASKIATNLGVHVGIVNGAFPERMLHVFEYVSHNLLPPASTPSPSATPTQPAAAAAAEAEAAEAAAAAAEAAEAAAADSMGDGDASESEAASDDDLTVRPFSEETNISSKETNLQKETLASDGETHSAHAKAFDSNSQQQQQQQHESEKMPDSLPGSSFPAAAAAASCPPRTASQGALHPQPDSRRECLKDTEGRVSSDNSSSNSSESSGSSSSSSSSEGPSLLGRCLESSREPSAAAPVRQPNGLRNGSNADRDSAAAAAAAARAPADAAAQLSREETVPYGSPPRRAQKHVRMQQQRQQQQQQQSQLQQQQQDTWRHHPTINFSVPDEATLQASPPPFIGTIFVSQASNGSSQSMRLVRRWILALPVRGAVYVDLGCARSLVLLNKSLFAAGVKEVRGTFVAGECLSIFLHGFESSSGMMSAEIGRCVSSFSSQELNIIKGHRSKDFEHLLGYSVDQEVSHRHDLVLVYRNGDERLQRICEGREEM